MASIKDDRGYNQGFKPSKALVVRTQRRAKDITGLMDKSRPIEVLEIGGGTGELAFEMAKDENISLTSTDLCQPFIEQANKTYQRKNLKYTVADSRKLPKDKKLSGKKFDYIVGNGILHHLYADLEKVFQDLYSLLKPGGKIVFYEPNIVNPYCYLIFKYQPFRKMANLEPGEIAFTKNEVVKLLEKIGFRKIRITHKDFLLPNTPDGLIGIAIKVGDIMEMVPIINKISQSILIEAKKR